MAQQSSRPLGSMLDLKQWHCTEFLSLLRPPKPTWITHLAKPSEPLSQLAQCSSLRWGHSHSRISMLATPRLEQPAYAPQSLWELIPFTVSTARFAGLLSPDHCTGLNPCQYSLPAHCVVPHRSTKFAVVSQQLHTFHKATSSCPWKCSLRTLTWF